MTAIRKKFLSVMWFEIFVVDSMGQREVIEVYEFSFKYSTNSGVSISMTTSRPSSREVTSSIRELNELLHQVMRLLEPIPQDRYLAIKLAYVSNTPDEFEPQHFSPYNPQKELIRGQKIRIGKIATGFHDVRAYVQSSLLDTERMMIDEPSVESQPSQHSSTAATQVVE